MARQVDVVAHTHWDREWYAPFEHFRSRLTGVLDALLAGLDDDPSFRQFLLDGQMAMIDDYLGVRPEAASRIRSLAEAGRLTMGPWYVLMDEFCVSGETIIRNLQRGLGRAAEFGQPMPVGYLPDMFGHIAQMPQLLRLAGFEHTVVWRGVPAAIDRTGFWWRAPDGSTLRAEYLPVGYANGGYLPADPDSLLRRLEAHEAEVLPFLDGSNTPLLLMNGNDHQPAQLQLPALLSATNAIQDHFELRQASLAEHVTAAPIENLPEWAGELRSGARTNVLMSVLSNRVDIKMAAAAAERTLERLAEPLATLWLPEDRWPSAQLDEAWLAMIRNSAHDSICACSSDRVVRAVQHRFDTALSLAEDVVEHALEAAAADQAAPGTVIINPSPMAVDGVVEAVLGGHERIPGTQVLSVTEAAVEERQGTGTDLGRILAELAADGWLSAGRGVAAAVGQSGDRVEVHVESDESRQPATSMGSVLAEAWAQAGAHRHDPLLVRVERRASQRVAALVRGVPGYGWASLDPASPEGIEVSAGAGWLQNSLVRLEVDADEGTFSINDLAGLDRLVDGGDEGDTYTYSPPALDELVDRPESVEIEVLEAGPIRGRLRVRRRFSWPAGGAGGRRVGRKVVDVETTLELRAGEQLVRISTRFDNPSRDHRLRACFPLPQRAEHSVAECAFATVTRGQPEGSERELPQATFPSRRFVSAGGLTLTHDGLLEYELIDDGQALALTLLRATGMLSQPAPTTRPNRAGPAEHLEGPQLVGPHQVRYGVAVGVSDPWRLADLAWLPLSVVSASGGGSLATHGSRLTVRGAEVSALHRVDGAIELRVWNPRNAPTRVEVPGHRGSLVDLRGQEVEAWDGAFSLRPWGIATARLDASSVHP